MPIQGSMKPYYHCLARLKQFVGMKNEKQNSQVFLHTDEDFAHSPQAFRQAHEHL
jgi:hypothetical protein